MAVIHAPSPADPSGEDRLRSGVSVVGNVTVDLVMRNVAALPTWGTEVLGTNRRVLPGGQGYLLARALRHLGMPVQLVTRVGDDTWGADLLDELRRSGVEVPPETVVEGATSLTVALVRADGERAFVSDLGVLHHLSDALISSALEGLDSRMVCLVGLFNMPAVPPEAAARLLERSRTNGCETLVDTGWDVDGWSMPTVRGLRAALQHVDVFLPSELEALALTGEKSPEAAARSLLADGPSLVVVKCGRDGAVAAGHDLEVSAPAFPVSVIDTVGAGDVFNAGFIWARLAKMKLEDCLRFANATAAVYVSRAQDRFPVVAEVERLLGAAARVRADSPGSRGLS